MAATCFSVGAAAQTTVAAAAIVLFPLARQLEAQEVDTGAAAEITLPAIEVTATPLPGGGVDRDKVPATVLSVPAEDFARNPPATITETLFQQVPSVSVSDPNGNAVAQELNYRGFSASSLQGAPQGLAVYMNGIRLNEAFGDTVNWDLIPTNAIESADLWTNNPVFGLNALGGAINLRTKNGFTWQGFEGNVQGGSFGRIASEAQYGANYGDRAVYAAGQVLHDGGWRFRSPVTLARAYGDIGWRNDRGELHLTGSAATASFGATAATPVDLLELDTRAVYTTPQTTQNTAGSLALNGKWSITDTWQLQGNAYVRRFQQDHDDGNPGEFERCSNSASPLFRDRLCLEDDGFPRPNPVTAAFRDHFAILDPANNPIPCPPGSGNTCNTTPYGTIDRTMTGATTTGISLQATNTDTLFGHKNRLVTGGSIDHGNVNFQSSSTLGFLNSNLVVINNPQIPGSGSVIHTLGGFGYVPIDIDTRNTYYGLYALNVFDVTEPLSLTLGGRLNIANIGLGDQLGTTPDLNGNHTYTHLNPVTGLTYKLTPRLTAFGSWSTANRTPTPVELACADPVRPCLIESSLVADPPLKQVVAHTYEIGLRDRRPLGDGELQWQAALFRTNTSDDIISVASTISGRGFFQNVPGTRRQGFETGLRYNAAQWSAFVNYSFLDATYQFTGDLPSPNNPMADPEGNVHVVPGDQIPGIPQHLLKMGAEYQPIPKLKLGADIVVVGSRFFVGDDANQNPKLPGYWVANLRASYQVTERVQVFALMNNLFNNRYALYGTYFDPAAVANVKLPVALNDNRTEVLGPPLSVYGGIRLTF